MVGEIIENFILKDQNGNEFNLYDNLDKKILLVFYPKDNSPVCTKQFSNYQANIALFEEKGIKVVGINFEGTGSHQSFCNALGINFPVLYDENKKISRQLDALNFLGINKRKLVLVDENKKIIYEKSTFSIKYLTSSKIIKELEYLKLI